MRTEFDCPFFLFLGNADREGVTSKLVTAGIEFQRKHLESSASNWDKIENLLSDENLVGTVAKFTNRTFALMGSEPFRKRIPTLFAAIASKPHQVFIHESFFTGVHTLDESLDGEERYWAEEVFGQVTEELRTDMLQLMESAGLEVITYRTNAELSVIATEFVDASARHLLFRIYMPSSRMWAGEVDKILQLFRDYLNRIAGLSVRQEQSSTKNGIVYEFFGDQSASSAGLSHQFEQFSQFLDHCTADPMAAKKMLSQLNFKEQEIVSIIERYSIEARRLQIDMKHERERKLLSIRHRMEAELADQIDSIDQLVQIEHIVDSILPKPIASSTLFALPTMAASSITVNMNPQFIASVTGIVTQEVSGTQNFGPEPTQLLELIERHGGQRKSDLASAVYELEDTDAKAESRTTARRKLKSFLLKIGEKGGGVALGVLQTYIENKLGL